MILHFSISLFEGGFSIIEICNQSSTGSVNFF